MSTPVVGGFSATLFAYFLRSFSRARAAALIRVPPGAPPRQAALRRRRADLRPKRGRPPCPALRSRPTTPPTACPTATAGPPGTSPPPASAARSPTRTGWSPSWPRSTPSSGILKTGKEADVFLLRRGVPGTDRSCLLAAKRYRSRRAPDVPPRQPPTWRAGGSGSPASTGPWPAGTAAGREMIAVQWASAEFAALSQLYQAGVPVPYPVQVLGTEVCWSSSASPTAPPRRGWPRPGPAPPSWPRCGPSWSTRC